MKSSNTNFSLADMSYEDGLRSLSMHKAAIDQGIVARMPKAALENTLPLLKIGSSFFTKLAQNDILEKLKEGFNSISPENRRIMTTALAGAGVGALGGLGATALSKKRNKSYLSNMLLGAGLGGLTGGLGQFALTPAAKPTSQTNLKNLTAAGLAELPIEERLAKTKELEGLINYNPEIGALLSPGAATAGAGGYLAHLAKNSKRYSPDAMAKSLAGHAWQTESKGGKVSYPGSSSIYDPRLRALAGLLGKGTDERSLTTLFEETFHPGARGNWPTPSGAFAKGKLEDYFKQNLPKQTTWQWLTGEAPGSVKDNLANVLGSKGKGPFVPNPDAAKEMLNNAAKGVSFKDMGRTARQAVTQRTLPPGSARGGLAALGAGIGVAGLSSMLSNYLNNAAKRNEAKNALRDLNENIANNTP